MPPCCSRYLQPRHPGTSRVSVVVNHAILHWRRTVAFVVVVKIVFVVLEVKVAIVIVEVKVVFVVLEVMIAFVVVVVVVVEVMVVVAVMVAIVIVVVVVPRARSSSLKGAQRGGEVRRAEWASHGASYPKSV